MSDVIWVAGIRFPKTCGDYTLFKLDTQAAPKADGTPTFILRYKNNRNVFTLLLYRVEKDTETGRPASVVNQLDRSASTIAALANASGLTASPPVNVRVRSFYGHFIDRRNEAGAVVRDYTFIREFYGTFIKVRMTGGTLEEVLAAIGLLCDRIDSNTADIAIPAWKVDAETGPFGLRWGSKPSDLQSLGIKLLPVNETATVVVCGADDIPGDTGARATFMEFNKTTGLRSVWNSYLIYDDPEGSRLRAKVQELQSIFLGNVHGLVGQHGVQVC